MMDSMAKNLRLFAIKKSAVENTGGVSSLNSNVSSSKVIVHATPNRHCPMHGRHGSFKVTSSTKQASTQEDPERNSRKEMARQLRLSSLVSSSADQTSISGSDHRRSQSIGSDDRHSGGGGGSGSMHYDSIARRMSNSAAPAATAPNKARSSETDFGSLDSRRKIRNTNIPRDVFTGKVEFLSTLRKSDPKDDERTLGGGGRGRQQQQQQQAATAEILRSKSELYRSDPYLSPKRGAIVDSDFDFRYGMSSEPNWDNPGRFRSPSRPISPTGSSLIWREGSVGEGGASPCTSRPLSPTRFLKLDIDAATNQMNVLRRSESNPVSPKRTWEFGQNNESWNSVSSRRIASPLRQTISGPSFVPSSPLQPPPPPRREGHSSHCDFGCQCQLHRRRQSLSSSHLLTIHHSNPATLAAAAAAAAAAEGTASKEERNHLQTQLDSSKIHNFRTAEDERDFSSDSGGQDTDETLEEEVEVGNTIAMQGRGGRIVPPVLAEGYRSRSFPTSQLGTGKLQSEQDVLRKHSFPAEFKTSPANVISETDQMQFSNRCK
jgi:hypothetical protein